MVEREPDPAVEHYKAHKDDDPVTHEEYAKNDPGFNYEHGTTDEEELEPDEPPKSGEWVDVHDVLASPTVDETKAGNAMGQYIDTEDDEDNGER